MAFRRYRAVAALLLATSAAAVHADVLSIQWKQILNLPKGQNLPSGIKADILGIEVGDTFAEAKAKLEALAKEAGGPKAAPIRQTGSLSYVTAPGTTQPVQVSYIAWLELERHLPGSKIPRGVFDRLRLRLSAPSSGHQVLGIERAISYADAADQPRTSEIVAQLKAKFKGEPQVFPIGDSAREFVFQFNDRRLFVPANANLGSCYARHGASTPQEVAGINRDGQCDVVFRFRVTNGVSADHAAALSFILSDNDRAKADLTADATFVKDYAASLAPKGAGAPPKL
jgi:hypothetical protein